MRQSTGRDRKYSDIMLRAMTTGLRGVVGVARVTSQATSSLARPGVRGLASSMVSRQDKAAFYTVTYEIGSSGEKHTVQVIICCVKPMR